MKNEQKLSLAELNEVSGGNNRETVQLMNLLTEHCGAGMSPTNNEKHNALIVANYFKQYEGKIRVTLYHGINRSNVYEVNRASYNTGDGLSFGWAKVDLPKLVELIRNQPRF